MKLQIREYRRVFWGALALDGIYLLIALIFSFLSLKTLGGLALGTGCAVLNFVLLEWSAGSLCQRDEGSATRFYFGGYLGRLAIAGVCLAVGFQWLDPFAVAVPMLAPRAAYLYGCVTNSSFDDR